METVLKTIWDLLNTPAGITAMAAGLLWALNKLFTAKPAWAKYEGTMITAIKYAEKRVPDGTPNRWLAKLDTALKYVINVHEKMTGKKMKKKEIHEIEQGLQIKHDELVNSGTLKKKPVPPEAVGPHLTPVPPAEDPPEVPK